MKAPMMIRPMAFTLLLLASLLAGCQRSVAVTGPQTLRAGDLVAAIDPGTLHLSLTDTASGRHLVFSNPQAGLAPPYNQRMTTDAMSWSIDGIEISVQLTEHELRIVFESQQNKSIAFPVLGRTQSDHQPPRAWVLPIDEGHLIPDDDADWAGHLAHHSPTNTLEGLMVPFLGILDEHGTATWIIEDPINNTLAYVGDGTHTPIGLSVTHHFNPVMDDTRYRMRLRFTGASPIAPALAYREYLLQAGELRTLAQKIADNPRVDRLRGALHAYIWDEGLISAHDLRHAKPIAQALLTASADGANAVHAHLWQHLDEAGRTAVHALVEEEWASMYLKHELAAALNRVLANPTLRIERWPEAENIEADQIARLNAIYLQEAFPDHLAAPNTWGDGISIRLLDLMKQAGIQHAIILGSDPEPSVSKPHVSAYADELGYLFGPYDSYHSIHSPSAAPDNTWETAQFDQALWETGGIQNADGSYSTGFKGRGRHLSPLAARPYVESRIGSLLTRAPHSAWFVDCDAYGQLFDDYTPGRMCSKYDDMRERLDRMRWMSSEHQLVIGSEGGSAYAANAIHFAHGITTPVIGWGDPQLTQPDSDYFLGKWWPPYGPAVFVKQVPLAPNYEKFYYDPRFRLPLYQAVFHDCVVATHHWGYHSLKFSDQVQTTALTEQLYNTPPLVHLNLDLWKKHGEAITQRMAFFAPIHRESSLLPLTNFRWLDENKLIQQTTLGERYTLTANFSDTIYQGEGWTLAPRSAGCVDGLTGEVTQYTP